MLAGLTRNLDLAVLDRGFGAAGGQELSFFPRGNSLGVVLPSNSPGVHSLWVPAFALKVPLVLKPGGAEPWTPYRIIQALIRAGAPPEAFCYYPADHAGGGRDPAPVRARHGLRRHRFHETLAERSAYRGAWAGLQQDRHRPGRHRRVGEVPGRDGRVDRRELRAVPASTPRGCGSTKHARGDRGSAGRAAGARDAARCGRSRSAACAVCRCRRGRDASRT